MAKQRTWSDEQLIEAVKNNISLAGVLKELGLKVAGGTKASIKKRIEELNLDTSHMKGQGWNVGMKFQPNQATPLSKILVKGSTYTSSKLSQRLLKEGVKERKCERCGRTEWEGEPIPIELHHINGDHYDHRIENLQFLCPNCHALTENYKRKKQHLLSSSQA